MEKINSLLRLAAFASETDYDTLPPDLTAYIKQLLLDTLGCGVAGMASDKGKWGIDFVRRCYGAPGPATVLGYGDRLSTMGAAFANAELINGLDFEPAGLHVPPYVLPPVPARAKPPLQRLSCGCCRMWAQRSLPEASCWRVRIC